MVHPRPHARSRVARIPALLCATLAGGLVVAGCSSSFEEIDRRVEALMIESNDSMGGDNRTPLVTTWDLDEAERQVYTEYSPTSEYIPTVNPAASELEFTPTPEDDAENVIARLERYREVSDESLELTIRDALAYSIEHSREYRFAEEEFVLTGLRLLIERHLWGPRFFNDLTATIDGDGNDGLYDTSLSLVNEFRVTQRLPYGGTVSARALARATEELHGTIIDDGTASADIILQADVPLLRGAGTVARESRIQAERDMIYATREFERFRREFLVDIATEFLDLVVQVRGLSNSERNVEQSEIVQERATTLYEEGRYDVIDATRAENQLVNARDRLNNDWERYRLSVDNFKVRLGMPLEQEVTIVDTGLSLPVPDVSINDAVRLAMAYRLDLQNERDQLADARRGVDNARNELLPDLDLNGSVTLPTDDSNDNIADFRGGDTDFTAGVTFGLPLDREVERINVRQSQINLERSRRNYERFRDRVATDVRAAVRGIDAALFSLQIQERAIEIAELGVASIDAAPERADIEETTSAVNQLLAARDSRDSAFRNVQVAILEYLRDTGQLRVLPNGSLLPPEGMELPTPESVPPDNPNSSENGDSDPVEPDSGGNFGVN